MEIENAENPPQIVLPPQTDHLAGEPEPMEIEEDYSVVSVLGSGECEQLGLGYDKEIAAGLI
jgi:regulator of chromosome condensation